MQPRLAVRRHESPDGSWEIAERRPHPSLAWALGPYVGFVERSPTPVRRREVAQDRVTVILGFDELAVGSGEHPPAAHSTFVAPIDPSYAITEFTGVSSGIELALTPAGARGLLGVPLGSLPPVVDLEDLAGPAVPLLVERLHGAGGWARRFDLLDRVLARRLADAPAAPPDVAWAWRRLCETGGRIPAGDLAVELGCSRRHLAARFREHVGPTPKAAARILRFRRAADLLARDDGARLGEIALDCGYYDQAHLNRDFRELAGTAPTAYLGARLANHLGVAA